MNSSEEESDEDFELQHWNNWAEAKNCFTPKESTEYVHDFKFGNWIPPTVFTHSKGFNTVLARSASGSNEKKNIESSQIDDPIVLKKDDSTFSSKWKVNEDWGERVELNDVTKFNDGDLIWGVVNLSWFSRIRMWVNQYKNLCVLAEGTLSKVGSTESALISIVNSELLRKMLCLKTPQWASLCQEVVESETSLNFDAFLDFDETKKSSLDKMWFFMCKRRHFLQEQCMLVKLNGAVKCLQKFEIIPKLVVQDIRDVMGKPIL